MVDLITGYLPPDARGVACLSAQALVLLSLTILLSTRLSAITAGVACVAIYGLAWIGGIIGGIGVAMGEASIGRIGDLSRLLLPTDGLWRGVVYHLEPRELLLLVDQAGPLTAAFPFLVEAPPTPGFLAWCVLWFTVVLGWRCSASAVARSDRVRSGSASTAGGTVLRSPPSWQRTSSLRPRSITPAGQPRLVPRSIDPCDSGSSP